MGGWNYRVLKHNYKKETWLEIHEVYYNKKDKPYMCTKTGSVVSNGDNIKDIRSMLNDMKKALKKPILEYDSFTDGGG